MRNWLTLTALILVLSLTGCLTSKVSDVNETKVAADYLPPLQAPANSLQVGKAPAPYQSRNDQERYTLSMVDMDIRVALAALSRMSSVPVVAGPEVSGTVNLAVKDLTFAEILMTMIKPLGYSASVEDGLIVVDKPGMVTRAFYLNYLKDKRTFSSVTNASISSTDINSGGNSGTTSSNGSYDSTGNGQGNVRVTTTGSSDFWEELLKGLNLIVFGEGKNNNDNSEKKVIVNDMAGVVYVTDTSENMKLVSSFLADIEREIKRQVLIQAHIVEIDLDKEFSLGLDWNTLLNSGKIDISQNLVSNPASGVFSVNISSGDFNLMLDAFKEQGTVNMLSSPKISTMNNQKAVIKLTTKEVTWINSTTVNTTGETLTTSTIPQVDEVGLFLDVTPNIDANGKVSMHVHPSISEIKSVSVSPDQGSSKPVINVREVDTIVDVKSGQTVVIAGLIADRMREVKRSVPLLGDIPYLGLAFSNFHQEHKKAELVIFLTPFVLEGDAVEKIRQQHEDRLQRMDEISRFVESRSWNGWNSHVPGHSSLDADTREAKPDIPAVEAVAGTGELPVTQKEVSSVGQGAPAADSVWVTPPPQRSDGQ